MATNGMDRVLNRWRVGGWSMAALLLALPLLAMQFSSEMQWDRADFAMLAAMLIVAGLAFEVIVRLAHSRRTRAIGGVAIVVGFLTVFADAAVGIF